LLKALEDIEEYQQISANIQIKQYLMDTRNDLKHMVKVVNMRRSILTHIDIICDITWSWVVLKDYIRLMQQ
jgi:WASH complex subunit strumpellin